MHIKKIAIVGLLAVGLSGCQTTGMSNQDMATGAGVAVGAVFGGLIGNGVVGKLAGIAVGGVVGGIIGNEIGKNLTPEAKEKENAAMVSAMTKAQVGVVSNWSDMGSDASGTVTVTAETTRDGQPCKTYTETLTTGGKTESLNATSCRASGGQWHRIST